MAKTVELTLHDQEWRRLQGLADSLRIWPPDLAQRCLRFTLADPQHFLTWLKQTGQAA